MSKSKTKRNKQKKAGQEQLKKQIARKQAKFRALAEAENILNFGRKLTRRQFDAYCYCREPLARFMADEVEWYSLFDNKLLATVFRDTTDNDFGYIILGRDARRLFRCIDLSHGTDFKKNLSEARRSLARKLKDEYVGNVQPLYPQDDEKDAGFKLFKDVIPTEDQHPLYVMLKNEKRFEAARNILSEIVNSFIDNDGHFEREFQSMNFQSKLWELYLHIYIHNAGFSVDNNHPAPDFEVNFFSKKVFIEAVTVNPSQNDNRPDLDAPETSEEIKHRNENFMPIKFGSSLFSKLSKKYWEKPHVKSKPLVIAVHDYHNNTSMTWSRTALSDYLYGVRASVDNEGLTLEKIDTHTWEGKEISSGFFNQENSENISAVLFSNQATIPKFNRMGKIAGLGCDDVHMIRQGLMYNPNPDALTPIPFSKDVDDPDYEESWADGLVMYHNPNAIHPVDPDIFHDISHISYSDEKGFHGFHQPFDILDSITIVLTTAEKEEKEAENSESFL